MPMEEKMEVKPPVPIDIESDLREQIKIQEYAITDLQEQIETKDEKLTKVLEGNRKIAATGQEVCLELIDTLQRQNELIVQLVDLQDAADALYMAGRWTIPEIRLNEQQQSKLWEDLRSALGYEAGHSTEAADPDVAIASEETVTMTSYMRDDDSDDSEEDDWTVSEAMNYHLEEIKSLLEGLE